MWYVDESHKCRDCGSEFPFSAREQHYWYEVLHIPIYVEAIHCAACRKRRRGETDAQTKPDDMPGIEPAT
jgi:hypothetical protein